MENTKLKILEILDLAVKDKFVKSKIDSIVERVEKNLENDIKALMAWEPIPLDLYNQPLPDSVKSSWIFILRKNSETGAERHPNSIQRMMSYKGSGDFQTKSDLKWDSNFLVSDFNKKLNKRWISIPKNVWHQGVVGDENWTVLSFHTCEISELIEERPVEGDDGKFQTQNYVDK